MSILQFDCRFAYPAGFELELKFEIGSGITALSGPSGCGKTTTLHLIAGILKPDAGRIALGEQTLFDSDRRINLPIHRRRVGLVFQDYQLFPHLTVEGNLRYGAARRTVKPTLNLGRLIDVLQLAPLLKRFPGTLSGGQRQRVALGRAIASEPAILLLDEPVSALDATLKSEIVRYLSDTLGEFPIPTLLVTHDQHVIQSLRADIVQL
jgi:molybdate transport system ATP-binding protein